MSPFRNELLGAQERVRVLEAEVAELRGRLEGRAINQPHPEDGQDRFGPETSWTRAGVVMALVAIGAILVSEVAARAHTGAAAATHHAGVIDEKY